ncbi:HAD-IIA family hydrolase [Acidipropionibacterium acidipropionici]|uniref:HAD-IIA family hydrolase n=1 Tax=Acidipropionibacterium acidipropionici TaxID=1748 RepID=UPI000491EDE7|nr:HAD-IIA family hydrolase [Acidipropionibacterium acidipropionici]ALN15774.1 hydrolase [Acidipropionibacterium acidipropionici]APZ08482.1 hydrolase [Acidipropionibacterium acidipropionici]
MTEAVIDAYDAALFDLDGVIYLGPEAIPAAPATVEALLGRGIQVGFVTNNAARSTEVVAEQLNGMGIPVTRADVVSSAEAIAQLVAEQLPAGSPVLVAGAQALIDEVAGHGLRPVSSADDGPVAVIQGYDPQMTWPRLDECCIAIQRGARWYVSNPDSTRPTDRGLVPGAGAQMAVVATSVTGEPVMAGKPHRPLLDATVARLGCHRPIFVGDRLDTDILGANRAGMDSLLVLTGAHGGHDLLDAEPQFRPTRIARDLSGLLEPERRAVVEGGRAVCGHAEAQEVDGVVRITSAIGGDLDGQLDALAAVLALVWEGAARGEHDELDRLDLVH